MRFIEGSGEFGYVGLDVRGAAEKKSEPKDPICSNRPRYSRERAFRSFLKLGVPKWHGQGASAEVALVSCPRTSPSLANLEGALRQATIPYLDGLLSSKAGRDSGFLVCYRPRAIRESQDHSFLDNSDFQKKSMFREIVALQRISTACS